MYPYFVLSDTGEAEKNIDSYNLKHTIKTLTAKQGGLI